jgi:EmrB/QacA subfamily drug resistance transporter
MNLSTRDRSLTLIGILLALFLGALDQTIVATALPNIVQDLNGLNRYVWVATAYLLASTVLVPIYGKLADMVSRKATQVWAIGLFLLGSALCGLAGEFGTLPVLGDGMNQLIVFRAVQGLGGAGLFAMAFIIIADLFPPNERGRYQGLVGAVFGIASVLGPIIGGFLTDYGSGLIPGVAGWRWVFYVNIPFGAVALWFILSRMPALKPQGQPGRLEFLAAVLLIVGLVPFILALQLDRTAYPWTSPTTLVLFGVSALALILFVARSLQAQNPILDLRLFANRVFTTSNIALFFMEAAFLCIIIFLPLFMVNVLGVSATQAGASLIPLSLGVVFGSIVSGQLVSRFGHYKRLMLAGGVVLLVGTFLLSSMSSDIPYWQVTLYMVMCGLGLGPAMPLYTLAIQNSVESSELGQATSANQFFRQIGGTVGAALMGSVLATMLTGALTNGTAANISSTEGISQGGIAKLESGIRAEFAELYAHIERAVRENDQAALLKLEHNPQVPKSLKVQLEGTNALSRSSKAAQDRVLEPIQKQLKAQADGVVAQTRRTVKVAYSDALTRVYLYTTLMVAAGLLATLLIPELQLRTTNVSALQAVD